MTTSNAKVFMKHLLQLPKAILLLTLLYPMVARCHDVSFRSAGALPKIGQIEWVRNDNLPTHWNLQSDVIKAYIFVSTHSVTPACRNQSVVLTRPCLSQFEMVTEFQHRSGSKSRFSYKAMPELQGQIDFFTLLANETRTEFSASNVASINFNNPRPEYIIPRPSIYDGTEAQVPHPNLSTTGDICIDSVRGNDANSGLCPNQAVSTIWRGLERFRDRFPNQTSQAGRTVLIRGGIYREGLNLIYFKGLPGAPITVRGYPGETAVISRYTTHPLTYIAQHVTLPTDGQEWKDRILGGYHGIDLDGAEHVVVENLSVEGAMFEGVNLDNAHDVKVRFVNVMHSGKWGMQAFGSVFDLVIEGCRVFGTLFSSDSEHGIYIAPIRGPGDPIAERIILRSNITAFNARFGIQVNGTAQDVLLENNISIANKLGGINTYGMSGFVVRNNISQGNNNQAYVAFHYFDDSYDTRDAVGVDRWRRKHFSGLGYGTVTHNTWITGPQAAFPQGLNPQEMDTLRINEETGNDLSGNPIGEPFFGIEINNNILSGMNTMNVALMVGQPQTQNRGDRLIEGVKFENNLIFSSAGAARVKLPHQMINEIHTPVATMESLYPDLWSGNLIDVAPQLKSLAIVPTISRSQYIASRIDPLLNFDFAPQTSSAARDNASMTLYASGLQVPVILDLYGNSRSLDLGPDIGAIEARE